LEIAAFDGIDHAVISREHLTELIPTPVSDRVTFVNVDVLRHSYFLISTVGWLELSGGFAALLSWLKAGNPLPLLLLLTL
jgi:hypothetical protein